MPSISIRAEEHDGELPVRRRGDRDQRLPPRPLRKPHPQRAEDRLPAADHPCHTFHLDRESSSLVVPFQTCYMRAHSPSNTSTLDSRRRRRRRKCTARDRCRGTHGGGPWGHTARLRAAASGALPGTCRRRRLRPGVRLHHVDERPRRAAQPRAAPHAQGPPPAPPRPLWGDGDVRRLR